MKENDAFNNVLALIIVIGFFAIVGIMIFHEIPQASKDMLGPLIGAVIGASFMTIVNYKWGSSSGSAAKSDHISMLTGTGDGKTTNATSTLETKVTAVTTTPPEPPKETT